MTRRVAALLLLAFAAAPSARAQVERERVALSLGGGVFGGQQLGAAQATFQENRAPSGGRLTYFDAALESEQATLWQARLGVRALGGLWVEAGALAGTRRMNTALSSDFEGASPRTASSDLDELQLEGGLRYDVGALAFRSGRGAPFLFASGGWLRQSPEGESAGLTRDGGSFALGAGLAYRLMKAGWLRGIGLRLDAGWEWRSGGYELEDGTRSAPRVTLSVYASH
jgi:hypothetical protein